MKVDSQSCAARDGPQPPHLIDGHCLAGLAPPGPPHGLSVANEIHVSRDGAAGLRDQVAEPKDEGCSVRHDGPPVIAVPAAGAVVPESSEGAIPWKHCWPRTAIY